MRWPTSMLGGPPKCGTSSLFGWLGDHPRVAVPKVKETFFFVDEDSPFLRPDANVHRHGPEGYRRHLGTETPGARHLLDGTTHTLFQHGVIDLLADLDPRPHVIFVLRKPSRRVLSSFRFAQHNLAAVDPELSFSDYAGLVRAARLDELRSFVRLERTFYVLSRDLQYSRYVEHLDRWRARFDREHLHLVLFEEMCAEPRRVVAELAARLDLDPVFYDDYAFAAANPTVRFRSPRAHRLARRLARVAPKNRVTSAAYRLYLALQRRGRPGITAADERALAELDEDFAPFDERLARDYELDLGGWW